MDIAPARLQVVKEIPKGRGWLYEPKFDGYRGWLMTNAAGHGAIYSRNAKDLGRFFPELVHLAKGLPRGTVLDGEIVQPTENGVSFFELQQRLAAPLARLRSAASESPVAFVAFDLLQERGEDIRKLTLSQRRQRLEKAVAAVGSQLLQVIVQVDDAATAAAWLDDSVSMNGIEGVVAKQDEPYPKATVKRWQKVRRLTTSEFLVIGFVGELGGPLRLVLGRHDGETVRIVGSTLPIGELDSKPLRELIPLAVPGERPLWAPFVKERIEDWYQLPRTLIAEVVVTRLDNEQLRQPARFVRWRLTDPDALR